jgi:hypothetical protein
MGAGSALILGVEMSWAEQFEQALKASDPTVELREVVGCLLAQGHERQAVAEELQRFRSLLQRSGREEEEDIVLEVMDFLAGWCSPHMAL